MILREALHRANTETAELGVHVCKLTAENEEARLRCEGSSSKLQEMDEGAESLRSTVERLRLENRELLGKLGKEGDLMECKQLLENRLSKAQQESEAAHATIQEEIQSLRFQLSSRAMSHSNQLQVRHKIFTHLCCIVVH